MMVFAMTLRLLIGLNWRDFAFCLSLTLLLAPYAIPSKAETFPNDHLTPYSDHHHGSGRYTREIEKCQHTTWENRTFEEFKTSTSRPTSKEARFKFHKFADSDDGKRYLIGTIAYIEDPYRSFSVLEPSGKGGCERKYFYTTRSTVLETAKKRKYGCKLAANAGYFSMTTGQCFGNVVSDGRIVQTTNDEQNANFGIREDGTIVVGYIPDKEIRNTTNPFRQLVTGVIWLVRNGTNYVNESMKLECSSHEDTGKMETFVDVISARTALGHDAEGRLVMALVEGQTHKRGANLYEFADLLIRHGVVNAINTDGGGSSTLVRDGVLVNYPSDHCSGMGEYRCPREVSTTVCVHDVECIEPDCSGHGSCDLGLCSCDPPWAGEGCERLNCSLTNCSGHGTCEEGECDCEAGWTGDQCEQTCQEDYHGKNCRDRCWCFGHSHCDPVSGKCLCKPGYQGTYCWEECWSGFFGSGCTERCPYPLCSGHGSCSSINGSCVCEEGWRGLACNVSKQLKPPTINATNSTEEPLPGSGEGGALLPDYEGNSTAMDVGEEGGSGVEGRRDYNETAAGGGESIGSEVTPTVPLCSSENITEIIGSDPFQVRRAVALALIVAIATLIVHAAFCFLTRKWAYHAVKRTYACRQQDMENRVRHPPKRKRRRRRRPQLVALVPDSSSSDCSI